MEITEIITQLKSEYCGRCKLCDYRALDSERLTSHMRTNHGGVQG
jgi:hypothetical protein